MWSGFQRRNIQCLYNTQTQHFQNKSGKGNTTQSDKVKFACKFRVLYVTSPLRCTQMLPWELCLTHSNYMKIRRQMKRWRVGIHFQRIHRVRNH